MTEPLVPADVDLSNFGYMPLWIGRLQKSKAWLRCKRRRELAFPMLNLWMRAWHETPAGSLEDDDDVLADAAMVSPAEWSEMKTLVMNGWIKCSDGRLYHPVVAELALEAWSSKERLRERMEKARQAKAQRNDSSTTGTKTEAKTEPKTASAIEPATALKGEERIVRGEERRGEDKEEDIDIGPSVPVAADAGDRVSAADLAGAVETYNATAQRCGLPLVKELSKERRAKLRQRLRDGPEPWLTALAKLEANRWMHGDNDRGWRADFDFLLQAKSFTKLIEGSYDRKNGSAGKHGDPFLAVLAEVEQRAADRDLGLGQPPPHG